MFILTISKYCRMIETKSDGDTIVAWGKLGMSNLFKLTPLLDSHHFTYTSYAAECVPPPYIIATFETLPTMDYLQTNYPEIFL